MARVMITGARAPVALHLARLFAAEGHVVVLADSLRLALAAGSRAASAYVRLPGARGNLRAYAAAVAEAVEAHRIDRVIPTCEEVFYLAAARDVAGRDLPLLAPPLDVLAAAHDKARFAAGARGLGADPPRTDVVTSRAELAAIGDAGARVLKPGWSRFAARVLIRPGAAALAALALSAADPWLVQDYLPGEELCAYAVAREGQMLGFAAYRPGWRAGQGAGISFAPVDAPEAAAFAAGYVARAGWTGQISFDFRRDADGALHAIECNPRATSGVHFFAAGDGLPAAMLAGTLARPTDRRAMTVKLALWAYGLPLALRRGAFGQWRQDMRAMGDVMATTTDGAMLGRQMLALAEIGLVALRTGKSLEAASTHDIEWNGEPFRL